MKDSRHAEIRSVLSGEILNREETVLISNLREGIFQFMCSENPALTREGYISLQEMNVYRRKYLTWLIHQESGELETLDKSVVHAIENNAILSENIEEELEGQLTFGQRLADRIAEFGGSWTFIIFFFSFLLVWISVNAWMLSTEAFDPYPFILLNLMLSCLAAIQAPIIMMSQNRQEQKDRKRSEHDYKINLKAELEIKLLNEKIDYLIIQHNRKLLEIQAVQADYLEDLMREMNKKAEGK